MRELTCRSVDKPLAVVGDGFEQFATSSGTALFIGLIWWLYRPAKAVVVIK